MSSANLGMNRGELDLETSPFMELYEQEQVKERKLGHLEPLTNDDFIIDESPVYVFALLGESLKNKKIPIEEETSTEEVLYLRPVELDDKEDGFIVKYEVSE